MKTIIEIQAQIQDEAIAFLRNELYATNSNSCHIYLRIMITADDKKESPEIYEEDITVFKALFNSGNENYKIALWNRLTCLYTESTKFYKKDFSRDEFAFIKAALKASSNPIDEANVNKPIETDRLILRGMTKHDSKPLAYHYKYDGDAEDYFKRKPTNDLIKRYAARRAPTFFTIVDKSTHSMIGYIGLSLREQSATGLLEYYIFKEYRKQGYCKEAVKALVDVTMADKLYTPKETVWDYIYDKKAVKLNAIRARISTVNTASLKTVAGCGFVYEATIHKTMHKKDIGWTDEEIYYITKELHNGR